MLKDRINPLVAREITAFAEGDFAILDDTLRIWLNQFRLWLMWQRVYNE